jgi:rhodanese-related sulfurtransferase
VTTQPEIAVDALDLSFVTDWLAVGAAIHTPAHLAAVLGYGVTHVLDCRTPRHDRPPAAACGCIAWFSAPTEDDGTPRGAAWYASCLRAADAVHPDRHVIYVHCAKGANRSPAAAYVILRSHGWSPAAAGAVIVRRRPAATGAYFRDAEETVGQLRPELRWAAAS